MKNSINSLFIRIRIIKHRTPSLTMTMAMTMAIAWPRLSCDNRRKSDCHRNVPVRIIFVQLVQLIFNIFYDEYASTIIRKGVKNKTTFIKSTRHDTIRSDPTCLKMLKGVRGQGGLGRRTIFRRPRHHPTLFLIYYTHV